MKFNQSFTNADLAVITLADEIKLSELIIPACLPNDKNSNSSIIVGEFSGWNTEFNAIEDFNSTFSKSNRDEFHEISPNEPVKFAMGKQKKILGNFLIINSIKQARDFMLNNLTNHGQLREFYQCVDMMRKTKQF